MATDVILPDLGDGIDAGDVLELLVAPGDSIDKDQALLELETDKATVTIPSPAAGKLVKFTVAVGDTVPIGGVIAQLEASAAPAAPPAPAAAPAAEEPPAPAPAAPEPAVREPAPAPAPVAATPAPQAPPAPTPTPVSAPPVAPAPVSAPVPASPTAVKQDSITGSVAAGPAVRKFARELNVDLATVTGTGEGGRITRDDILRAVREASSMRSAPGGTAAPTSMTTASAAVVTPAGGNKAMTLPGDASHDDHGPVRVERLSKIRKTIAAQMHKSWSTVPRVTNFDDADVTDLEIFRKSSKDDYAAQGIKLTTMPFLIKAVSTALRLHPTMNAVLDLENDQITYRDYVNLGIAVDTDRGLVVPNIRHTDSLSIPDIAKALADMASRVRGGDFGVNELRGGTFTISNLGAIGGTYSTPIVNVPEVAILLVGRTRKLPVVMDDDSIVARQMMPLSLSYDHRLVDGGTAARFLNDVIAYLEAPSRLLLAIT